MGLEGSGVAEAGMLLWWSALSVLNNKDKAALPWKENSFFYSSCPFKKEGRGEGRGFEWYFDAEPAHAAVSGFHRQKFARASSPFAGAKAGCVRKGERDGEGRTERNSKENKPSVAILMRTRI